MIGVSTPVSDPRRPARYVSFDKEPVVKRAGSKDDAKSVKQIDVTPKSPEEYQGRNISSLLAAANTTAMVE